MCEVWFFLAVNFLVIVGGTVALKCARRWFLDFSRKCHDSHSVVVDGPYDNLSVVRLLAGDVNVVYSPLGGGRYLPRERTVLLEYPLGSKFLWALLEAAHESGHANRHCSLALSWFTSTPVRRVCSVVVPATLCFLAGLVIKPLYSGIFYLLTLCLWALFVAALTWDKLCACQLSRRWLCSYLRECGHEALCNFVSKMVRAEMVFQILDGVAMFVFVSGVMGFFWSYGGFLHVLRALRSG